MNDVEIRKLSPAELEAELRNIFNDVQEAETRYGLAKDKHGYCMSKRRELERDLTNPTLIRDYELFSPEKIGMLKDRLNNAKIAETEAKEALEVAVKELDEFRQTRTANEGLIKRALLIHLQAEMWTLRRDLLVNGDNNGHRARIKEVKALLKRLPMQRYMMFLRKLDTGKGLKQVWASKV